ncbi:MAG: hypothetical protein CMK83_24070 [Pseudomonadales bacterium]|nr:hypothetical protein [Pseudomonadales bacterium]MBI27134.1 hypothetical protein [Pseudomonadales bacterium]HAG96800.1 hypothetical protein [Gammaproteobacteria bacterium]|tara:strand:+ start:54082 stop:54345 length:264 start_codon:yes stop_codon:yes gene_type:complete
MSESIPAEAIEAKKSKFVDAAKQAILARLRPVIEYKIREAIAPGTITDEQELNQYYVDEAVNEHEASGKTHGFKSFSDFAEEQRGVQ